MIRWTPKKTEAVVGGCRLECWELPNGRFTALVTLILDGAVVAEMGTGQADGLPTLKAAQEWAGSRLRDRLNELQMA
jgi:hypothetical protein